ncbi:TolC family protein [Ahniella affigens]|uniref:TolC family protein n=1 Tax=Ahniella affigens TaxID=2021234 RepID=UPI001473A264|nr:TolC family protein [Ahniella affigens]
MLGTGDLATFDGAEITISLASVIERGGKRAARSTLADAHRQTAELMREGRQLDILAEVARRYLDAAAAHALAALLREDLTQRERLLQAALQRRRAGIEQEAAPLSADAQRARTAAELEQSVRRAQHARQRLAVLWGSTAADFSIVPADFDQLPPVPSYQRVAGLLADTPELKWFAHESRLREARLQLARTSSIADIDWQVGVRRLESGSDFGLVGSISIPLGSAARADSGIRAADAELAAIAFEREGRERILQSTLVEAWAQIDLATTQAQRIDREVIPALNRAAEAAERSYRAGASSLLEWNQMQVEIVAARRERLDAALTAYRGLIELQRLTGQTFSVGTPQAGGATP